MFVLPAGSRSLPPRERSLPQQGAKGTDARFVPAAGRVPWVSEQHWLPFTLEKVSPEEAYLSFLKRRSREGHRLRPTPARVAKWIAPGAPHGQAEAPTGQGSGPGPQVCRGQHQERVWNSSVLSILSVDEKKIPAK